MGIISDSLDNQPQRQLQSGLGQQLVDNRRKQVLLPVAQQVQHGGLAEKLSQPQAGQVPRYNVPQGLTIDEQLAAGIITPEQINEMIQFNQPYGMVK